MYYAKAIASRDSDGKGDKSWIGFRKHLKKIAQERYPGSVVFWAGGQLYRRASLTAEGFPVLVEGMPAVAKPGRQAVGWAHAHLISHKREKAVPDERAAESRFSTRGSGYGRRFGMGF